MTNAPTPTFDAALKEFHNCGVETDAISHWVEHRYVTFRRNRCQAVTTFPIFTYLVARYPDIPAHMEIEAAIDRGDPLIDALSVILGMSKKSVRFMRGKSAALVGIDWLENPSELFDAIDHVCIDSLPRSSDEWSIFRKFWVGCGELTDSRHCQRQTPSRQPDVLISHLLAGLCSAGYAVSMNKLRRMSRGRVQHLAGVKDYIRFVTEWCESGAGICRGNVYIRMAGGTLCDELLTRYSAMELIRQSERWHREIARIMNLNAESDTVEAIEKWPALPGLPLRIGDLTVFPLTNAIHLRIEGGYLNHCVGTYFWPCVTGASHIVSIRDTFGSSLSTAEISLVPDKAGKLTPVVIQHQGESNGEPNSECNLALASALEMLHGDDMQASLIEIQQFHTDRQGEIEALQLTSDSGYPHRLMCDVMKHVLRDYESTLVWLDRRLDEEEGWHRHRNEQAGERLKKLGFGDEITNEQAWELYRATGVEGCLDAGISLPDAPAMAGYH